MLIRSRTRLHAPLGFPASPSRAGGLSTCLPRAETLLLTSLDDVITPRQQPHKPYQICAHQAFAYRNRSHRRAPRPPARKTQKSGQPKASHASQIASKSLSRAASDSSLPDRLLGPRAAQTALSSTDLLRLRIWCSYEVARASTRHLGFRHLLHAPVDLARAFHALKHCC